MGYFMPRFGLVSLGWVGFYGISTIVGYLMPNPVYTYILNIYVICKHILYIKFLNEPDLFFAHGFKYCYITGVKKFFSGRASLLGYELSKDHIF